MEHKTRTEAPDRWVIGDSFAICRSPGGDAVDLWSARRLPFDPKGELKEMRDRLATSLRTMECAGERVLHATYTSGVLAACDTENVLFYNVGSAFSRSGSNGLRFERVFAEPPVLTESHAWRPVHHHRYDFARSDDDFRYYRRGTLLADWDVQLESVSSSSDVAWLWHLMRSVPIHVHAIQSGDVSPFALSLTLHAPEEAWVNPPNLLKPWFDAVVSAFQAHNGDDLSIVSERLSKKLDVAQSDISACLMSREMAVLGVTRLLYPRAESVQWSPADHRCVAGELLLKRSGDSQTTLSGELFEALPMGSAHQCHLPLRVSPQTRYLVTGVSNAHPHQNPRSICA